VSTSVISILLLYKCPCRRDDSLFGSPPVNARLAGAGDGRFPIPRGGYLQSGKNPRVEPVFALLMQVVGTDSNSYTGSAKSALTTPWH